MSLTLIPEDGTGKTDANTYASQAECDTYHDARLHALAWTAAPDATKIRALAMATKTLDSMVRWQGKRKTAAQALAWPREGTSYDGLDVSDDMVPKPVKDATCELARLLIGSDLTSDVAQNDLQSLNLGKGALEIEFKGDREKQRIPTSISDLLQGLGTLPTNNSGGITVRKVGR